MAYKKDEENTNIIHKDIKKIKEEIDNYTKDRVEVEVETAIRKAEKKLINHKNVIIFKKDILIIILLLLCGYLTYIIYKNNYFKGYDTSNIPKDNTIIKDIPQIKDNDVKAKKHEEYFYLMDNIKLYISSDNITDFYKGNLTDLLKLELSAANINKENIIKNENTFLIDLKDLENEFIHLFGENNFINKNFIYKKISFKYIEKINSYMGLQVDDGKTFLINHLPIEAKKDDYINISSIEYYIKDKYIYNIFNNKRICEYKNENSIISNKDKLTIVNFTFKKNGDYYNLVEVKEI